MYLVLFVFYLFFRIDLPIELSHIGRYNRFILRIVPVYNTTSLQKRRVRNILANNERLIEMIRVLMSKNGIFK